MRTIPRREQAFFRLFCDQAAIAVAASEALRELLSSGPPTATGFTPLDELEHRADAVTHQILVQLRNLFIVPLDRDDIYRLAHELDTVVDAIEHAGQLAVLCGVVVVPPPAHQLVAIVLEMSHELALLVGFIERAKGPGRGSGAYRPHVVRIHELENQADRLWSAAFTTLFREQPDPLEVIKWQEIYGALEAATDAIERVAERIEALMHT